MKRLGAGMLLCACVLALTACHGSKDTKSFSVPETFDESDNITVTFWAKNDTNKNQTAVYERAANEFEKLYPNVDVNIRLYTDYGKIYNDVITNISTNTTPNVCITYPDHIATYLQSEDSVVALDELMSDPVYGLGGSEVRFDSPKQEEIIPKFLEECSFAGHYYALPYMRSTEACYVNRDFVEKLGYTLPDVMTWDFIWEVSEAATAKDADGNYIVNGQKTMIPFIYKSTDNMMISMLKQLDAGYSTDMGEINIFNDTTAGILKEIASHGKTGAFSTFKISSYPANFLNAGQCIFAIDSTAGSTWMGAGAPLSDIAEENKVEFETVVLPIPQYDTSDPKMISQGPSICIFNKEDPQEVLASWLFAQFLLTNDIQIGYAETEGYVPVTSKARETEEYREYLSLSGTDDLHYKTKIDATKLLLDNTDYTFVTPVFNGSASLRDAAGALIENVVKKVRRKGTVDDAYIEELYADIRGLYRLDRISGTGINGAADLGPLPAQSVALLATIVVAWICIGVAAFFKYLKKR
ncbi:MAG: carbohydrate ABC transporter substrate-binding protein [Lachnospiraceae bacterium]|nr:carbohydrate ABC transporter substrate-binding protein [Lachnospiraceae bacterium]